MLSPTPRKRTHRRGNLIPGARNPGDRQTVSLVQMETLDLKKIALREIAHCRSGEKNHDSDISVIAYDENDYKILRSAVTAEAVRELYGPITKGAITRYEVPSIGALNFVLRDVLDGGRSRTLAFDESGKALSSLMLTMIIEVPDTFVCWTQRRTAKAQG